MSVYLCLNDTSLAMPLVECVGLKPSGGKKSEPSSGVCIGSRSGSSFSYSFLQEAVGSLIHSLTCHSLAPSSVILLKGDHFCGRWMENVLLWVVFFFLIFKIIILWLQTRLICSQNTPEQSDQLFVADACSDCSVHWSWMDWLLNILNIVLSGKQ